MSELVVLDKNTTDTIMEESDLTAQQLYNLSIVGVTFASTSKLRLTVNMVRTNTPPDPCAISEAVADPWVAAAEGGELSAVYGTDPWLCEGEEFTHVTTGECETYYQGNINMDMIGTSGITGNPVYGADIIALEPDDPCSYPDCQDNSAGLVNCYERWLNRGGGIDHAAENPYNGNVAVTYFAAYIDNTSIVGTPRIGIGVYIDPASTAENFTGYGLIADYGDETIKFVRWLNQPLSDYGTLLHTFTFAESAWLSQDQPSFGMFDNWVYDYVGDTINLEVWAWSAGFDIDITPTNLHRGVGLISVGSASPSDEDSGHIVGNGDPDFLFLWYIDCIPNVYAIPLDCCLIDVNGPSWGHCNPHSAEHQESCP
jgi:hypothetical protein